MYQEPHSNVPLPSHLQSEASEHYHRQGRLPCWPRNTQTGCPILTDRHRPQADSPRVLDSTLVTRRQPASRPECQQVSRTTAMNEEPEILTLKDVARILRTATNKIYELTRARARARTDRPLPVFKIHSKMTRIRKSDLMKWLNEMVEKQQQDSRRDSRSTTRSSRSPKS
jgi:hypothetical protein